MAPPPRSIVVSSQATKPSRVAASGRGMPAGGIAPVRTLRMTFSQAPASAGTRDRSSVSSARPPVFSRWLWHETQ